MDLQDKLGAKSFLFEPVVYSYHRNLYYIGGTALNGHIHRNAFAEGACVVVG